MAFIICHYNEIGLKGENRKFFEKKLVENIKKGLNPCFFEFAKKISGRIIIKLTKKGGLAEKKIKKKLKNVFGISYFSFAINCSQDIKKIQESCFNLLKQEKFNTFAIAAKRSKKDYFLTSPQINQRIGYYILEKLKHKRVKVNLKRPKITCFIEIVENYCFIFLKKIKGLGGLPVGVSGSAISLISSGIDSPVASFLSMKRGIRIIFLHFHSYPYTNRFSIEKVKNLVEILDKYQYNSKLYLLPFGKAQKEFFLKVPAKLRIIFYRRTMLKIANKLAKREKAIAIITGESIGQVASQTLENIKAIEQASNLPIIRPLICFDKQEIIDKAKKIKTYKVSILPYQDCCVRFLPKHPETRTDLKEIKAIEKQIKLPNINRLFKSLTQS